MQGTLHKPSSIPAFCQPSLSPWGEPPTATDAQPFDPNVQFLRGLKESNSKASSEHSSEHNSRETAAKHVGRRTIYSFLNASDVVHGVTARHNKLILVGCCTQHLWTEKPEVVQIFDELTRPTNGDESTALNNL